jgi:hypothetical protein
MRVTKAQKKEATEKGIIKVAPGVYLATGEYMASEQKDWADEDEAKNARFLSGSFWLTTDDGILEQA